MMNKRKMPVTQIDSRLMAEIVRRIVDVIHPEEVEDWSGVRQAFVTTAIREGKVLYESQG